MMMIEAEQELPGAQKYDPDIGAVNLFLTCLIAVIHLHSLELTAAMIHEICNGHDKDLLNAVNISEAKNSFLPFLGYKKAIF